MLRCSPLVCLGLGLVTVACLGQEPVKPATAQEKARELLLVHCVDADGKPVAGAEVHVWQRRSMPDGSGDMVASGPFTSGEDGIAATAAAIDYDGGKFDRWVYARVAGKLVGALRRSRFDDSPIDGKLVVTLLPSRELRGRVKVPDGVRPEDVLVRVWSLSQIVGEDLWGQEFPRRIGLTSFQNPLPERFDCQVAKDGTFVLADIPPKPFVVLAATGPGLAQALWGNALLPDRRVPDSIEFELSPESRLGGVVTDEKGRPVVDAQVELRISVEVLSSPAMTSFLARTDAVGRFHLDGLPAGPFDLLVRSPVGVMLPRRMNLANAETKLDAKIEIEEGTEVAGVVTAVPGGEPVADVVVVGLTTDRLQMGEERSLTDAQGRFSMRLPTCKAKLYFGGVPRGFAYPKPMIVTTVDVGPENGGLQNLRFEIPRAK